MTAEDFQEKKETLIEVINSLLSEELDEAVAHEMLEETENFVVSALSLYSKDDFSEDDEEEDDGMFEYHGDMDTFSSEE